VACGICGSDSDKKTAVDILRVEKRRKQSIDLTEFKQWSSKDHPLYTLLEVFRYYCAMLVFGKEALDPHFVGERKGLRWPDFDTARLQVLAPEDWFCEWDNCGMTDDTVLVFRDAIELLKERLAILRSGYFYEKGLRLRGMTKDGFLSLLKSTSGAQPTSFKELKESSIRRIASWSNDAFRDVDSTMASSPDDESTDQPAKTMVNRGLDGPQACPVVNPIRDQHGPKRD
jgi:hypothetical protein